MFGSFVDFAEGFVFGHFGEEVAFAAGEDEGVEEFDHVVHEDLLFFFGFDEFDIEDFFQPEEKFGIDAFGRFIFHAPELVLGRGEALLPQLVGEFFEGPAFLLARAAEILAELIKADVLEFPGHWADLRG